MLVLTNYTTMKVITPIGAVVEVDECVYEANSHILKKYEEGEEGESMIITSKEEVEEATTQAPEVAPEAIIDENTLDAEIVETPEEVIEEANTEVSSETIVEPTPEVAPEETAPSEAQEEAVEESNTEVVIESTPEVAPENGDTEITAEVKTKATKAPKTK